MNIGTACCHRPDCADHDCQGRNSAIATRRVQEHELRRQCAASGQMSAAQIAAHARAGEFAMGYESADPAGREPVKVALEPLPLQFVGPEPSESTWPFVLVTALVACVTLGLVAAYLLTHWNTLIDQLWPSLVFAASF